MWDPIGIGRGVPAVEAVCGTGHNTKIVQKYVPRPVPCKNGTWPGAAGVTNAVAGVTSAVGSGASGVAFVASAVGCGASAVAFVASAVGCGASAESARAIGASGPMPHWVSEYVLVWSWALAIVYWQ